MANVTELRHVWVLYEQEWWQDTPVPLHIVCDTLHDAKSYVDTVLNPSPTGSTIQWYSEFDEVWDRPKFASWDENSQYIIKRTPVLMVEGVERIANDEKE